MVKNKDFALYFEANERLHCMKYIPNLCESHAQA